MKKKYPKELLDFLKKVKGKRSRVVIDHILEHGIITTEDLEKYGYKHPPRAARDVREQGVPLKTVEATSSDGKRIAGYVFGDISEIKQGRIDGRAVIPKTLKRKLIKQSESKCFICLLKLKNNILQVDHRVPYEVTGDTQGDNWDPEEYMLLCGSCQRAKSWSCEHCNNWISVQDESVCEGCYWAHPESYTHIAQSEVRRLDIAWKGKETKNYDAVQEYVKEKGINLPEFVKDVLRKQMEK